MQYADLFYTDEARAASMKRRGGTLRTPNQILAEDAAAISNASSFDVFLSHAYVDGDLILGVKALLEGDGLSVYVDWQTDPTLDRTNVSSKTAAVLRTRMQQSKSLFYVATANSSNSKWMPWELGYFDGLRNGGVAILPLLSSPMASFEGQEYLGLYPVVRRDTYKDGVTRDVFVEENGRGVDDNEEICKGQFRT
ncbi:MAG: toll-Interleukin receptor [Pseudomonadota bacterium]